MTADASSTTALDAAHTFRAQILAERERIEAERRLPDSLAGALARAGFFRIALPSAYGGLDLTPTEELAVYDELARADASTAWTVWNANTNWTTVRLPTATAKAIFSRPEAMFANSTQPKGRAVIVDGGYRVSGQWSLVSGCQLSEGMQLTCVVYEDGAPRLTSAGAPETRLVFCSTTDCEVVDMWASGGLRGTGSHDVVVHDLFVPAGRASWHSDPLVVPGLGTIALGIAHGAIEALIDLAKEKVPERSGQTLSADQGAQARLAEAEALVRSARLYLFDAVDRLWQTVLTTGECPVDLRTQVLLANYHAVTCAVRAVDLVYLTGGATSLYTSCLLERAFRDVHAVTQHAGVHPKTLERTGRVLFGLEANDAHLL